MVSRQPRYGAAEPVRDDARPEASDGERRWKSSEPVHKPSGKGSADWFTGVVRIDPGFKPARAGRRVSGALVTFEPGARHAWHTHPLGQTLIVVSGCGPGSARGRSDRGNPARRHRLVRAGREALARGRADHRDEPHRHSGKAQRLRPSTGWRRFSDAQYGG